MESLFNAMGIIQQSPITLPRFTYKIERERTKRWFGEVFLWDSTDASLKQLSARFPARLAKRAATTPCRPPLKEVAVP